MYIKLEKLVFLITHACPGRCLHCQSHSGKGQKAGALDGDGAEVALRGLAARHPIHSVLMFGGEPMLHPQTVYRLVSAAAQLGIEGRDMISNGMVEGKKDTARARAAGYELKQAGIVNVLVSVDAFHEVNIPVDVAYAFAQGLKEAKVNVRLHPAWVLSREHDNPYNNRTREILKDFEPLGIPVSEGNVITPIGNAPEHLREYYKPLTPEQLKACRCGVVPYTHPLNDVKELHIGPNGEVLVCGFEIGNIHERELADIIEAYDPFAHEHMALLMEQGPYGLSERARRQGAQIEFADVYTGCQLCERARAALVRP